MTDIALPDAAIRRILSDVVRGKATKYGLNETLIFALIEQESAWCPWAMKFEAGFYRQYVAPLVTNNRIQGITEAQARATSWGLMQTMGQTAREFGFDGPYLSELCNPDVGAELGCRIFRHKLDHVDGNIYQALLNWNGGANKAYPDEVLARTKNYESAEKTQENST